ncbi:ESCRT-1 complex, Vps28 subunit [Atractiella rhizophila]|nr:ESCRT-1 complex, Vps28 subunit [Atractiella rhizophila]
MSSQFNLDEEIRPFPPNERERFNSLSTLYSILVSLNFLEKAYIRDSITPPQYTPACTRLLARYKTITRLLHEQQDFRSVDAFCAEYRLDVPAASHRVRVGVPATVEHSAEEGIETAKWVAETTHNFITIMDALKLNLRAKDQLHHLLTDLISSYSRFKNSGEWEGRPKILSWLITLNQMRASDEISEDQSRQMFFDLERAYNEFFSALG